MTRQPPAELKAWLTEPLTPAVAESVARLRAADGVEKVCLMPDVHLASEVCIGAVVATEGVVYPQAVGGDIGCGWAALQAGRTWRRRRRRSWWCSRASSRGCSAKTKRRRSWPQRSKWPVRLRRPCGRYPPTGRAGNAWRLLRFPAGFPDRLPERRQPPEKEHGEETAGRENWAAGFPAPEHRRAVISQQFSVTACRLRPGLAVVWLRF